MSERLRPLPIVGLERHLTCEGLHDDYEGFRLILRNRAATTVYALRFDSHWAYRVSEESHRLESLSALLEHETAVVEVDRSRFVEWLRAEASGTLDERTLRHFVVLTSEQIFDVVAAEEPRLERLAPRP